MLGDCTFERDVSATETEFSASLRAACPGEVYGGPQEFTVNSRGAVLIITIEPTAPRRIASIVLPRLIARYRFTSGTAESRSVLLTHLDRAMQRGGG